MRSGSAAPRHAHLQLAHGGFERPRSESSASRCALLALASLVILLELAAAGCYRRAAGAHAARRRDPRRRRRVVARAERSVSRARGAPARAPRRLAPAHTSACQRASSGLSVSAAARRSRGGSGGSCASSPRTRSKRAGASPQLAASSARAAPSCFSMRSRSSCTRSRFTRARSSSTGDTAPARTVDATELSVSAARRDSSSTSTRRSGAPAHATKALVCRTARRRAPLGVAPRELRIELGHAHALRPLAAEPTSCARLSRGLRGLTRGAHRVAAEVFDAERELRFVSKPAWSAAASRARTSPRGLPQLRAAAQRGGERRAQARSHRRESPPRQTAAEETMSASGTGSAARFVSCTTRRVVLIRVGSRRGQRPARPRWRH